MADKRGPGRERERFPTQKEYTHEAPERNLEKEMQQLAESIKPEEQMSESNQDKIDTMLKECEEGKCKSKKQLDGYKAYTAGKFDDPSEVHPGHIGYLFANNVLTEGREIVIGEYEDGYAFYHKKG